MALQRFAVTLAVVLTARVAAEDAEEVAGLYMGSGKLDDFGSSVSVSGDFAIVGAKGDDSFGEDAGVAYIFERRGGDWSLEEVLKADDITAGDHFGASVEISGELAIVGAYGKLDGALAKGAAYVFSKASGSWVQEAKLVGADTNAGDRFGIAVSITEEGYAVVGSEWHSKNLSVGSVQNHGAAYIYAKEGASWVQQAKLLADDLAQGDRFGSAVGIDGAIVVVGASEADDEGAAYVFERNGSAWGQQAKLQGDMNSTGDLFGSSLSVSGRTVLVGAYWDDELAVNAGAAYIFTRNSTTGKWDEGVKLMAVDGSNEERFGSDVAVHGNTMVIGAYWDNENGLYSGSAYVYAQLSPDVWSFKEKLAWSNASAGDNFGKAVSVWDSGFGPFSCLIGAPSANWSIVFEGGIPTTTTTTTHTSTTTTTTSSSVTTKTISSTTTETATTTTTSVTSTTSTTSISMTSTSSSTVTSTSHTGTTTSVTETSTTTMTHTSTSKTVTTSTSSSATFTSSTRTLTTATTTSETATTSTDTTVTETKTTQTQTTSTATTITATQTTATTTTTTLTSLTNTSTTQSSTGTTSTSTTTTYTTMTSSASSVSSTSSTISVTSTASTTGTSTKGFLARTSLQQGTTREDGSKPADGSTDEDEKMNNAPSSKVAFTALVLAATLAGI
eukprot:TRINITY_DN2554_c0_g1_i9.p1 TRINITY_DN2554_c0_g1~~TRINITY_DN2554_c0_g1_i9.p1  ORF type:complete len:691 (-),score=134.29 TRINITY_DN2554_c0_g1_i9:252-2264(-)